MPLQALGTARPAGAATTATGSDTLEAAERRHITAVLDECDWVVGGPAGAAARLGMKRSTLQFRIAKLGIVRPRRRA